MVDLPRCRGTAGIEVLTCTALSVSSGSALASSCVSLSVDVGRVDSPHRLPISLSDTS
jgi:hypothetical protein